MHYNCLIVDDETDLARMTAEYFKAFGLSCEYVDGKESCFAFFKENTADLIQSGRRFGFRCLQKDPRRYAASDTVHKRQTE